MRALVVCSRSGALIPEEIKRRGIPLLYLQGGIHPGESDGKDAGFISLREILLGAIAPGVLDNLAILFVPAFNADGHERLRPLEPAEPARARGDRLARRRTQHQSQPRLHQGGRAGDAGHAAAHRPLGPADLAGDLHVTDGADFEPDISLQAEPIHIGDERLWAHGVQLRDELIAKLAAQGSIPLPFILTSSSRIPRLRVSAHRLHRGFPPAISPCATG